MSHTILRSDFRRAIEAGIKAAGDKLTEAETQRLRVIAETSTNTGDTFASGCPWSQAFGCPEEELSHGHAASIFAKAYDSYMLRLDWTRSPWNRPIINGDV